MASSFNNLVSLLPLALFLALLFVANAESQTSQSNARQCRLDRIQTIAPSQQIQHEGGIQELWDESEDQLQCTGVGIMRNRIQSNSLLLPVFQPSPSLVYIQQGQGLIGLTFPGCPETYHSSQQQQEQQEQGQQGWEQQQGQQGGEQKSGGDQHQKIRRVQQGDIIAIPSGVAHWCFNDGDEELIAVNVADLNNEQNQLDQNQRGFFLAGGQPQGQQQQQQGQQGRQQSTRFQNVFQPFDENLMSAALNVPVHIVRKIQRKDERGFIVRVEGGLSMIRPDEEEESYQGIAQNGLEESQCNMRVRAYLDNPREADIYSKQAGKLNLINQNKLPILSKLGMSAEKGNLLPNAVLAPHWSMNAHSIIYVTNGNAQVQIVGSNGQTVLNDRVQRGQLYVIPQYFAATIRAERDGFEWVSFKTSSLPMISPIVGQNSVFRGLPIGVLTNSYQISSQEAQNLKNNRAQHPVLLPPSTRSSS